MDLKTGWLKPTEALASGVSFAIAAPISSAPKMPAGCQENDVLHATRIAGDDDDDDDGDDPSYVCQATHPRQYVQDLTSGNVGFGAWLGGVVYTTCRNVINLGIGVGAPLRWPYGRFQSIVGGAPIRMFRLDQSRQADAHLGNRSSSERLGASQAACTYALPRSSMKTWAR